MKVRYNSNSFGFLFYLRLVLYYTYTSHFTFGWDAMRISTVYRFTLSIAAVTPTEAVASEH